MQKLSNLPGEVEQLHSKTHAAAPLYFLLIVVKYTYPGLPRWCSDQKTHLSVREPQETWAQSLGGEDPLEYAHCSLLAWRTPRTEAPGGLRPMWSRRVGHDRVSTRAHTPPHTPPQSIAESLSVFTSILCCFLHTRIPLPEEPPPHLSCFSPVVPGGWATACVV